MPKWASAPATAVKQAEAIRLLTAAPQDAEVQVRLADHLERADYHGRALVLQAALRQDRTPSSRDVCYGASGLWTRPSPLVARGVEAQPLAGRAGRFADLRPPSGRSGPPPRNSVCSSEQRRLSALTAFGLPHAGCYCAHRPGTGIRTDDKLFIFNETKLSRVVMDSYRSRHRYG